MEHFGAIVKVSEPFLEAELPSDPESIETFRFYSDASQAGNYKLACCHCVLGDVDSGMEAVEACLKLGCNWFDSLRLDGDLKLLREDPRFEKLIAQYDPADSVKD